MAADTVPVVGQIPFSELGAADLEALRTVLDQVRAGNPRAPIDVPTVVAGTVRWAVAGDDGLANVRFSALPTEDIAAKEAHYAPQLAQHQSAIRAVGGGANVRAQLVFAAPARTIGKG